MGMATLCAMKVLPGRRDPWLVVGSLSALAFLVVATLVVRRGSLPFDEALSAFIQGLPIPRVFWEFCSGAGGSTVAVVGVTSVVIAALVGRPRLAIILAGTMLASLLFTDIVKELVERPRPPGAALVETSGWSFPSSHALSCTTTYGLLAVVVWRTSWPRRLRLAAIAAGVTVPILVGLSRIGLDVHYPSDVLGGWLAGVVCIAVAATLISATEAMDRAHLRGSPPTPGDGGPGD
jgi:undecaprenyl-diphosphatase